MNQPAAAAADPLAAARTARTEGDAETALAHYRAALAADPAAAGVHAELGDWLLERGDAGAAAQSLALAAAWSGAAGDYDRLGLALRAAGQERAARRAFERALERDPDATGVLNNLAQLLYETDEVPAARAVWQRALALDPGYARARLNLAFLELGCGELASGWALYEARHAVYGIDYENLGMTRWDGAPLADGALLVLAEQGVGDEILFASCLPDVRMRVARVTLFCEPRLAALFARSFPGVGVVPVQRGGGTRREVARPDCTHCIEAGSLPGLLRTTLADFPATPGYLLPDPARAAQARRWLAGLGRGAKVGICWRSGLRGGARARHYATLADCAPLFALPGIRWVSLQYDDCTDELAAARTAYGVDIAVPPFDQRHELDQLAALLTGLDLVVSAATAVGELAGALGVPVWRFQIGLGWTAHGTDGLPWHPATRLWWRVPAAADWAPTFAELAAALPQTLRERRPDVPAAADAARQLDAALRDWQRGDGRRAGERAAALARTCPELAGAWHLGALAAREQGDEAGARAAFLRALTLAPADATIRYNAGALYERAGRLDLAVALYRRAVALAPDWTEARAALAETLNRRAARALDHNRPADALADLAPALELAPAQPDAWNNAALALLGLGRLDEACGAHDEAQRLAPDDARYRWNAAYTRLAAGQIAAGWADYRWRWRGIQTPNDYPYPEPPPGAPLAGRHVFVYAEQGLGDEILFASCLPDLFAEARAVTLECDPRLVPLFARSFPDLLLYGSRRADFDPARVAADIDVKLPLGELACRYRPSLAAFPAEAVTLVPDRCARDGWRARLAEGAAGRALVGLVWRSSLRTAGRTGLYPPLDALAARLARPNLRVVVLQHDADPDEFARLDAAGVDWLLPDGIDLRNDLDGLAALLAALDLCVGGATATVELAGAVGLPTWRLYPCRSWVMLGAPSCPWHPQLVDFTKPDFTVPWDALLDEVGAALDAALPPPLPGLAQLLGELLAPGQLVALDGAVSAEWDDPALAARLGPAGLRLRFGRPGGDWPGRLAAEDGPAIAGAASPAGWWAARRSAGVRLDGCALPRCDWLVLGGESTPALAGAAATLARARPFLLVADDGPLPAGYGVMTCVDAAGRGWRLAFPRPQSDTFAAP